jgi:hypothetical protein
MKVAIKSKSYGHESSMAGEKGISPRKAMASGVRRTVASAAARAAIWRSLAISSCGSTRGSGVSSAFWLVISIQDGGRCFRHDRRAFRLLNQSRLQPAFPNEDGDPTTNSQSGTNPRLTPRLSNRIVEVPV